MPTFIPGQRWISETEPELGLGMVISSEYNRVTVLFIAANERRIYALNNAPLTRVQFTKDDRIEDLDGRKLTVDQVTETDGILTYQGLDEHGDTVMLEEMELNHFMQFNKPQERLFTGQLDSTELFALRQETLAVIGKLDQSPVRGLTGSRTSIIPHQLYIAHTVSHREAPRVLLADEVGLGKTIEAGLILHHQLLTGRAERVLILAPEPLLHQWLVEMRRRFNLKFSLFDEARYLETHETNPFEGEQLVLCGLDFFMRDASRQTQAIEAGWDLCVVDEAHHLGWTQENASPEYQFVEALGACSPGLLLLTATPEQLGKQSHFARLRLLDPDRFHSFDHFIEEEHAYQTLADLIHHLLDDPQLDTTVYEQLKTLVAGDLASELLDRLAESGDTQARQELIQLLLDRHGTGRILFRNTRNTIQGFPSRELHATPLPLPIIYAEYLTQPGLSPHQRLHPERLSGHHESGTEWWRKDPRTLWLTDTLRKLRGSKALVICALAETAMDLEDAMRINGIRAAVFHEGLSIVARDRAAAWFADEEDGAQVLICSEIGSEGRNFQFAHHLVLFDLPLNPDLLEQRIGRLDRIGQTETIRIHVAWFENSPQALLFRWYHEGLDAFSRTNPAAPGVFARQRDTLLEQLGCPDPDQESALITEASQLSFAIQAALHQGRDRLLELNSCRETEASRLIQQVHEADANGTLWPWLERVFDAYGVNIEEHSDHCHILRPGEHMRMQFPELPDEGVTITLDRNIALAREDMVFLTWEHPMVRGAIDLLLNSEHGNSAISVLAHPDLDPGQLLIECFHVIDCRAPAHLHITRFIPPVPVRSLFDQSAADLSHLPIDSFETLYRQFDREHALELVHHQRKLIEKNIKLAEKRAKARQTAIIKASGERMLSTMTTELKRLAALRKINPNVRQEELDQLKAKTLAMHECIQSASVRLDAIRLIVTA